MKAKYHLTVDSREKAALENTLRSCTSVSMIFSAAARSSQQTTTRQQAQPEQQQPASNTGQQPSGDWRQWDTNGNGRITCAEARQHGIQPVHRGHPAYEHMRDGDGDGVVCE